MSAVTAFVLICALLVAAFWLVFIIGPALTKRLRRQQRERAYNRAVYQQSIEDDGFWLQQLSRSAVPTYQEEMPHAHSNS